MSLCEAFVAQAPVVGAAFTVIASEAAREIVWASDDVSRQLAQMQYDVGDGPAHSAMTGHLPVLVGDVRDEDSLAPWPAFAAQVAEQPVSALFTFPLAFGGTPIGVCDSYSDVAGLPTATDLVGMLRALDRVTSTLLGSVVRETPGGPLVDETPPEEIDGYLTRAVIHQATGMASVHLGVGVPEAFVRLRAHAFGQSRPLHEIASDVVSGDLRMEKDNS